MWIWVYHPNLQHSFRCDSGVCDIFQARMLITEENLMTTIIRTFMDHLRHRDLQGRFQFERYTAQQAFKFRRVQSLIGDLK